MKLQNLSVRAFLRKIVAGTLLTAALLLLIFFLLTKDVRVVICGIILTAAFYIWGMVFLHYFQKKLSLFTDGLCQTLDHMMDSTDRPQVDYEAETLLSRISHRLERLYNVMQKTRHMAEGEKEELQSLVSDISHQTKTPIANLKLINDTMLTRPLTEEKRKEFLQATGTQLDKLDFLIQGMVKTSRLETGVITLEKQDAVIGDTLVSAINGVLAPMEQKEISLSVDCPSDLTISHDSRWTSEALFNILDNAVKYTSAGGSIQVRVRDWEMYLRIDVTDTGRGIPEHSQGTIFKRFYRDEAVHDIDGGGIGLYLIVDTDDSKWAAAKDEIQKIIPPTSSLYVSTLNDWVEAYNEKLLNYRMPVYIFIMFIGVFGIINLLNTLITNILTRKRELGVLQAVGLSSKQLSKMLLIEGLFYTLGVLLLSISCGTLIGYLLCTVFSAMSIFGKVSYHFPTVEMFSYFILMLAVQMLFSCFAIRQIKKQSLVDQIRELS